MMHALGRAPAAPGGPTIAEGIAVTDPGVLTREVVERPRRRHRRRVGTTDRRSDRARRGDREDDARRCRARRASPRCSSIRADVPRPERRRGAQRRQHRRADARRQCCSARWPVRAGSYGCRSSFPIGPACSPRSPRSSEACAANIVDVEHRRDLPGVALKSVRLDLSVETRDRAHADEIVKALEAGGFRVEVA